MSRTYDLEIAKEAKKSVINVLQQKDLSMCNSYKALVKKIPDLIRNNGYLPTLIFCLNKANIYNNKSKNKNEFNYVLENILGWQVSSPKIFANKDENYTVSGYIGYVANIENSREYMILTKEMINLFIWIKRFADGMIEGEK